jgi:hypothetical protein
MTTGTLVAVCGDSLFMASVAAGLQANPAVQVIRVSATPEALQECANDPGVAAIAFDMGEVAAGLLAELPAHRPGLLLLGIVPNSEHLVIMSLQDALVQDIASFVEIVTHRNAL